MKKILSVVMVLLLLAVPCAMGVSAADPAINANEQKILDVLSQTVTIGKTKYHIPDEYVNQAKNYFLTADISEADANTVITHINSGIDTLKAATLPTQEIKTLPTATKEAVLQAGKNACATVNLTLVYNTVTEKVTITNNASGSTVVFDAAPVVKVTGSNVNVTAIVVSFVSLVTVMVAAVVISKKARLF